VPLERNQIVCMGLEAKLLEEDYVWRWTTRVTDGRQQAECQPPAAGESAIRRTRPSERKWVAIGVRISHGIVESLQKGT